MTKMKSAGLWVCEDCDNHVQADYDQLATSGIPVCLECEEVMEFDHEVFFPGDECAVTITWLPGDIQSLREDWDDDKCADFLGRHRKTIQDRSIECGWDVIENCIRWDEAEAKGGANG